MNKHTSNLETRTASTPLVDYTSVGCREMMIMKHQDGECSLFERVCVRFLLLLSKRARDLNIQFANISSATNQVMAESQMMSEKSTNLISLDSFSSLETTDHLCAVDLWSKIDSQLIKMQLNGDSKVIMGNFPGSKLARANLEEDIDPIAKLYLWLGRFGWSASGALASVLVSLVLAARTEDRSLNSVNMSNSPELIASGSSNMFDQATSATQVTAAIQANLSSQSIVPVAQASFDSASSGRIIPQFAGNWSRPGLESFETPKNQDRGTLVWMKRRRLRSLDLGRNRVGEQTPASQVIQSYLSSPSFNAASRMNDQRQSKSYASPMILGEP